PGLAVPDGWRDLVQPSQLSFGRPPVRRRRGRQRDHGVRTELNRAPCARRTGRIMRPMKTTLVIILAAIACIVAGAQTRAPQNDSIRQEQLRADLFFLAGDAMRGRLTDTEENRAAADYIRSRFERAGLAPAAPGPSFFQAYNLMTPTLGDENAVAVIAGDGVTRRLR